jgi:spore maturation protein CgeB
LWGPGWSKFAPEGAVRGQYLDAEVLPSAYRSATIVLNDHFPDMARWGFINNRTFDAIACGTPMISDSVEGLEMFDGGVVVADTVERMRDLVVDRSWLPSASKMGELSELVRTEHSFDARARHLLRAALLNVGTTRPLRIS